MSRRKKRRQESQSVAVAESKVAELQARRALLAYIAHSGRADFVDGKMIFLQGSPVLDRSRRIPTGRLSGIMANHVPAYLLRNRMPSFATNSITDWETKVEAIVGETMQADMRLISGIPAWVQMYFERLLARTGKATVQEVFPHFSLFVYGGVNYAPYRSRMEALIGGSVPSVELFPASEGFIAYQDKDNDDGLLLVLDNFEHLLDAAPDIAALARRAPHLKLLVPSSTV